MRRLAAQVAAAQVVGPAAGAMSSASLTAFILARRVQHLLGLAAVCSDRFDAVEQVVELAADSSCGDCMVTI